MFSVTRVSLGLFEDLLIVYEKYCFYCGDCLIKTLGAVGNKKALFSENSCREKRGWLKGMAFMFQLKQLSGNSMVTFVLSASITLFHPDVFSPWGFTLVHPCTVSQVIIWEEGLCTIPLHSHQFARAARPHGIFSFQSCLAFPFPHVIPTLIKTHTIFILTF